jgi:hypothetical protein
MEELNDSDILRDIESICKEFQTSPAAALSLLRAALEWQSIAVDRYPGPYATEIEELVLGDVPVGQWPQWAAELLPPACKLELHKYPDGSRTARLLTPRGLVLHAERIV